MGACRRTHASTFPSSDRAAQTKVHPWTNSMVDGLAAYYSCGIALASLLFAVFVAQFGLLGTRSIGLNILPFYLSWLMSIGAIGSVAFIGMNALSVQQDITFDLTNTRLMLLRITLGALFGLVLTLPFGFDSFVQFCENVTRAPRMVSNIAVTTQTLL